MAQVNFSTEMQAGKRAAKAGRNGHSSDLVHEASTSSFFLLSNTSGVTLLWMSVAVDVVVLSLGHHWLVAKFCAFVPFYFWAIKAVDMKMVTRNFLFWVTEIFFKHFDVGGAMNVPIDGPVIFACAPHNNQFIDGVVAMRALNARKDIGFIAAASSCRKKYEGVIIKLLGSIPVERPQDVAVVGSGTIVFDTSNTVLGVNTKFESECKRGDTLLVGKLKTKGVIERIESNTRIVLKADVQVKEPVNGTRKAKEPFVGPKSKPKKYKVVPRLDQSVFFGSVLQRLRDEKAVGIFPEGGSHDRTELLPLKAGVALIALDAMASSSGAGATVPIIPVGINYFNGHRFRSRVFVDIGKPVLPSEKILNQFKKGGVDKREACNTFLESIRAGLGLVTMDAPDYAHLQFFRTMNKLYMPSHLANEMSEHDRLEVISVFSKGYERLKDKPEVQNLFKKVVEYQATLKAHRLPDHKVKMAMADETFADMSISMFELSLIIAALIPLTVISAVSVLGTFPLLLISRYYSAKKARDALKKSSVKLTGRDVIGTWKILTSVVLAPLATLFYVGLAYYYFGETGAVLTFFLSPMIMMGGIKAVETWKSLVSNARILIINAFRGNKGNQLIKLRNELKRDVRRVVRKFGWDEKMPKSHYRRTSYSDFGLDGDDDGDVIDISSDILYRPKDD
jgi:glycerol-3-phosphate O-acyltransferase / dihydroxyacetone phosphate acyltransferase